MGILGTSGKRMGMLGTNRAQPHLVPEGSLGTATSGMGMLGTIRQLGTGGWPQPCLHRYLDNVDATMSILDVTMLTGFSPDLQDLKRVSAGTWGHTVGLGKDTGPCIFVPSCLTMSPHLPNPHVSPHVLVSPYSPDPPHPCVPAFPSVAVSPHVPWCHCPRIPMSPCVPKSLQVPRILPWPCVPARPTWPASPCPCVPVHPCILMWLRVPTCPCVSCMPSVTVSLSPAHRWGGQVHLQV